MARILDTSKSSRIRDVSNIGARISADFVRDAFGAKPVARTHKMDLIQLRDMMREMLQSNGGRPALVEGSNRVKVPKLASDWRVIEGIAARLEPDLPHKPSPAQVAAVMLHWAVTHMSAEDVKLALKA